MARFDVYPMPGKGRGYLVDIQADLLAHLTTRIVAPLLPEEMAPPAIGELNPALEIKGKRHILVPQALAAIPTRELRRTATSIADHHDRITRALDVLLVGF